VSNKSSIQGTGVSIHFAPGEQIYIEVSDTLSSSADKTVTGVYQYLAGWKKLGNTVSIPSPQGFLDFTDNTATTSARFYRCREPVVNPTTDPQHLSCNTIGYVDRTIKAGYSMLSNPFLGYPGYCIPQLFNDPSVPPNFVVSSWNEFTQTWLTDTYQGSGVWSGPDCLEVRQPPGVGCVVYNPAGQFVQTFTGRVFQSYYEDTLPAALAIRSMYVPDIGAISHQLHFPLAHGLQIYLMRNDGTGGYTTYTYANGLGWTPSEPIVGVGDAFWTRQPAVIPWKTYYQTWSNGDRK
jgi:hypothetical protein